MKLLKYFGIGIYVGVVLTKSEAVSWFRIQEMFYFQSFHMYGVIMGAILVGMITVALVRLLKLTALSGEQISLKGKPFNKVGNTAGGVIFGLGWGLAGACPGPLYALLGAGYWSILVAILAALAGTIVYGKLKPVLPH